MRDGSFACESGSTPTEPVKFSAGLISGGCELLRVMLIVCDS